MPLHPPPTIANGLALVKQPIVRDDLSRQALLTFALNATGFGSAIAIANQFQSIFNTNISPNFDTNCTVLPPTVSWGDGTNVPLVAIANGAAVAGTVTQKVMPSNVALLVKKVTDFGGKKNRGRTYVPWFLDQAVVNEIGVIDAATITAFTDTFQDVIENLATGSTPMVIANKVLTIPGPPAKPFVSALTMGHTVTTWVPEPIVATQRRRIVRS